MYIRYLRRKDGSPYATVVGLPTEDGGTFGLARCNNKTDTFIKKTGRQIAEARARKQARLVNARLDELPTDFNGSLLEAMRTRLQGSLRGPVFTREAQREQLSVALGSIVDQRNRVENGRPAELVEHDLENAAP